MIALWIKCKKIRIKCNFSHRITIYKLGLINTLSIAVPNFSLINAFTITIYKFSLVNTLLINRIVRSILGASHCCN